APLFGAARCARLWTGPALGPASPHPFRSLGARPLRLESLAAVRSPVTTQAAYSPASTAIARHRGTRRPAWVTLAPAIVREAEVEIAERAADRDLPDHPRTGQVSALGSREPLMGFSHLAVG